MGKMWSDQLLKTLDIQYRYCKKAPNDEEQRGYYIGLKIMLERIVSNDYHMNFYIVRDSDGKHRILSGENEYDVEIIVRRIEQTPI